MVYKNSNKIQHDEQVHTLGKRYKKYLTIPFLAFMLTIHNYQLIVNYHAVAHAN